MILILTHSNDSSADMVMDCLKRIGKDFVRFNAEGFPRDIKLEISMIDGDVNGRLCFIKDNRRLINFRDITTVWNRRIPKPIVDCSITDEVIKSWAVDESKQALSVMFSLLEKAFWVNKIEVNKRLNFNKWLQMKAAFEVGLLTPASCMSNNPDGVLEFWNKHHQDMAYKVFKRGVLRYPDGKVSFITTQRLTEENLDAEIVKSIVFAPVFIQEYIKKILELRITVVGEKVFTSSIDSQKHNETKTDWRNHIFSGVSLIHKLYSLPADIEQKCLQLTRNLDLSFGCIDMIVTPDGKYVFLEINPNGQWGWVEKETGLPISKEIASLLSSHG